MSDNYDMDVDYETLCIIEDKLEKISLDLISSASKMAEAINRSQDFLAGNQFEKAKMLTLNCIQVTNKTSTNIKHARDYIRALRIELEEYGQCGYCEEQ